MNSKSATPKPNEPGATENRTAVEIGSSELVLLRGLKWEDDGPDRIRGYIDSPKTTLFIIERHPTKPYRGRMTGAVIPDEDEKPDGLLANALISWLQGCAAPSYLREFEDRILARRGSAIRYEAWRHPTEENTWSKPHKVGGPYDNRADAMEANYMDQCDEPAPDKHRYYSWEIVEVQNNKISR